jgi:hypothetical protein
LPKTRKSRRGSSHLLQNQDIFPDIFAEKIEDAEIPSILGALAEKNDVRKRQALVTKKIDACKGRQNREGAVDISAEEIEGLDGP